ncbi:MAG: hypothetical protein SGI73_17510 [Chloroflexota bacterium]|nr:hypothetical protein [Chloroflexota bacterium]
MNHPDAYVHFIMDVSEKKSIDPKLFNFHAIREIMNDSAGRRGTNGWTIIVEGQPNPVMKFVGTTISQLAKSQWRICRSLNEAVEHLRESDSLVALNLPEAPDNLMDGLLNTKG